ncbi:MAG: arnT 1 [Flavipsychrobacter sp.]|nr:arnT 1 [Flavipsychrobacter sp.]
MKNYFVDFAGFRKMPGIYLFLIILLCSVFCFKSLNVAPLSDWDETRYGMNAWNMLQRHDYINYFFLDFFDITVTKPPLGIYAICLSYKIFGYNEFAMRLPSAIAGFLFFLVFYQWCRKEINEHAAFFITLILLSVKGLVGWHVFRTGDLDGMYTLFITLANIFFYYYVKTEHTRHAVLMVIFLSLVYYTKGFTFILFTPGWLLYLILNRKLAMLWKWQTLVLLIIFVLVMTSWPVIHSAYSHAFVDNELHYNNFFQRMWTHDIIERYFSGFKNYQPNYQYIIANPDSLYNLWNYYTYLLIILYSYLVKKKRIVNDLLTNRFFLYSLISTLPLLIISFSKEKMAWYTCTSVPFYAVITAMLHIKIISAIKRPYMLNMAEAGLLCFCLVRNGIQLQLEKSAPPLSEQLKSRYNADRSLLVITAPGRESVYLYAIWLTSRKGLIYYNKNTSYDAAQATLFYKNDTPYIDDFAHSKAYIVN